jgi:four helix bundle protein
MDDKIGFENLEVWIDARQFTKKVYILSSIGPLKRDYYLRDQLRKSCISVVSNIAEGYERGGDREFHQFLSHAKASAGEMRAQLFLCFDLGYITRDDFINLRAESLSISRQLSGLMKYIKGSRLTGSKYKEK